MLLPDCDLSTILVVSADKGTPVVSDKTVSLVKFAFDFYIQGIVPDSILS